MDVLLPLVHLSFSKVDPLLANVPSPWINSSKSICPFWSASKIEIILVDNGFSAISSTLNSSSTSSPPLPSLSSLKNLLKRRLISISPTRQHKINKHASVCTFRGEHLFVVFPDGGHSFHSVKNYGRACCPTKRRYPFISDLKYYQETVSFRLVHLNFDPLMRLK